MSWGPGRLEDALVASLKGGPIYATAAQKALGRSRSSSTIGAKGSSRWFWLCFLWRLGRLQGCIRVFEEESSVFNHCRGRSKL